MHAPGAHLQKPHDKSRWYCQKPCKVHSVSSLIMPASFGKTSSFAKNTKLVLFSFTGCHRTVSVFACKLEVSFCLFMAHSWLKMLREFCSRKYVMDTVKVLFGLQNCIVAKWECYWIMGPIWWLWGYGKYMVHWLPRSWLPGIELIVRFIQFSYYHHLVSISCFSLST